MDFKQDLANYQGQQGQKPMGYSPGSQVDFNFSSDLQQYQSLDSSPIVAKQAEYNQKVENTRKQQVETQEATETQLIPNIEIDYATANLNTKSLTAVKEGTVGGQCGIYAQNVVKLPGGGSWAVGDSIQQKTNSVARYANAGLGFYPDQEVPKSGNTVIINPGTEYGHVAVVNSINPDGTITLTESNWNWDGRVTHKRRIRLDDPSIVGYIRTQ